MISYTVSARQSNHVSALDWIGANYPYPLEQIDSVFGFSEFSTLYGGRPYNGPELQDVGINQLYDKGIGYRIPLTNHFVDEAEYNNNVVFLAKHHRDGNTIICVNDDLAKWVKNDYPKYKVEASAIKKLDNIEKIDNALTVYDSVVLPAICNDDESLLISIKDKTRVRLFNRAGCAYNCPSKICYKSFSKWMKKQDGQLLCSMGLRDRQYLGVFDFDLKPLIDMGFSKFKAVPRG